MDSFQVHPNTDLECALQFCYTIVNSDELNNAHLRPPTIEDVVRLREMHERIHGVPGTIDNIDFMHLYWEMCPKFQKGIYMLGGQRRQV